MYTLLFSHKEEIVSFAGKGMGLEIIMLSNINQIQKDRYIFSHMQNLDLSKNKRHECKKGIFLVVGGNTV
jgi:hypothetical protein